ncbi:MAG: calcium/sodium antiporter [Bacteroidia bacterium]
MPDLLIWIAVFVVTLITLIISADFFIKASERIGLAAGIPPFIVGVTLIAIGTSLPELITSIVAVSKSYESSSIVIGNVIGSNITNIGLVLGIVGITARKIKLDFDVMRVDLPMMIASTFILFLCILDGQFSLFEGLICLLGLSIYLAYVFNLGKSEQADEKLLSEDDEPPQSWFTWKEPVILLTSAAVIYLSAKYNVEAIVHLAEIMEIGQEFIALTAVALGTSLPELVVSIVAVKTNNSEMAVGNILGSNIFNIFAVMGIPRIFGEIDIPESIMGYSMPALIVISLICLFVVQDREVNKWEGWILLLFYTFFIGNLVFMQM